MANKIIVADAGPLIAFARIKHLPLLAETFGEIIAPRQVLNECLFNTALPGAKEISEAMEKKLITPQDDAESSHLYSDLSVLLGPGESAAIILALHLDAGLLIDEKLGRQTAKKMNLRIIGTAGVLLLAKQKKIIKRISPLIDELKNMGYYLSKELIETILHYAKEKN